MTLRKVLLVCGVLSNIGAFLLWVGVLAVSLLRAERATATRSSHARGRVPRYS